MSPTAPLSMQLTAVVKHCLQISGLMLRCNSSISSPSLPPSHNPKNIFPLLKKERQTVDVEGQTPNFSFPTPKSMKCPSPSLLLPPSTSHESPASLTIKYYCFPHPYSN